MGQSEYKKTAKDLAWDRERIKLKKQIAEAQEDAGYWRSVHEKDGEEYTKMLLRLMDQEVTIDRLMRLTKLNQAELLAHIERTKRLSAAVEGAASINSILKPLANSVYGASIMPPPGTFKSTDFSREAWQEATFQAMNDDLPKPPRYGPTFYSKWCRSALILDDDGEIPPPTAVSETLRHAAAARNLAEEEKEGQNGTGKE